MAAKVVVNKDEVQRFRKALGLGMMNFCHAVEGDAKGEAPVRGGYRSFLTTKRTQAGASGKVDIGADNGSVLIGGTLRRSIHSAAWVDGSPVAGAQQVDENGNTVPSYAPGKGILGVIGTNSSYGAYVELGTVRMQERPFLGPAFDANGGRFAGLMKAGMKRGGY